MKNVKTLAMMFCTIAMTAMCACTKDNNNPNNGGNNVGGGSGGGGSIELYTISVSANPTEGGMVGGGGTYDSGITRTVTASANDGYTFSNWTENGNVVSSNASYTFTVNANRTLVANFTANAPNQYIISVSANPTEGGLVGGGGTYDSGITRTVTASANVGYTFSNWTENGNVVSSNASYTFTVNANRTLVANFTANASNQYTISVSANPTEGGTVTGSGTYNHGQTCNLTAMANCGYTFDHWTKNGTTITGGASISFTVTESTSCVAYFQQQAGSHDYVDLGIPSGLLWATCNVGASTPEEYGDYFAWGETQPKDTYYWSTYKYCNGRWDQLTKYCDYPGHGGYGFADYLIVLQPMDDAATANWGSVWRMPTVEEWEELRNNTTAIWTTQEGVRGRRFTATNGNSIFLPAAGAYDWSSLLGAGSWGSYWSSSLCTGGSPEKAYAFLGAYNTTSPWDHVYRYQGKSVRAVRIR